MPYSTVILVAGPIQNGDLIPNKWDQSLHLLCLRIFLKENQSILPQTTFESLFMGVDNA